MHRHWRLDCVCGFTYYKSPHGNALIFACLLVHLKALILCVFLTSLHFCLYVRLSMYMFTLSLIITIHSPSYLPALVYGRVCLGINSTCTHDYPEDNNSPI